MSDFYKQGDLILVNFDPTKGREPQKKRPALVVSTDDFNNVLSSLTMVCPITSAIRKYPLHIPIPSGYSVKGSICVEQLRGMDLAARDATKLDEQLDAATMTSVLDAIGAIFNI